MIFSCTRVFLKSVLIVWISSLVGFPCDCYIHVFLILVMNKYVLSSNGHSFYWQSSISHPDKFFQVIPELLSLFSFLIAYFKILSLKDISKENVRFIYFQKNKN